jgi:hypothetical protein
MERCGAGGAALSGSVMLWILGGAIATFGGVFWFAFRGPAVNDG